MARNLFTKASNITLSKIITDFEHELYSDFVGADSHQCYNSKTTTVILKLKSGFEVVGVSGCEDPKNFDEGIGYQYALKDALRKLGEFAAFHRAEMKRIENIRVLKVDTVFTPEQREEIKRLVHMGNGLTTVTSYSHPDSIDTKSDGISTRI